MNWQRMIEAARRHKMPLLVADGEEEPLVILSLGDYERLVGAPHVERQSRADVSRVSITAAEPELFSIPVRRESKPEKSPSLQAITEAVSQTSSGLEFSEPDLPEVDLFPKKSELSQAQTTSDLAKPEDEELPLEERFYLEPVGDEGENG